MMCLQTSVVLGRHVGSGSPKEESVIMLLERERVSSVVLELKHLLGRDVYKV
jgi:hypothetical protein